MPVWTSEFLVSMQYILLHTKEVAEGIVINFCYTKFSVYDITLARITSFSMRQME